MGCKGALGWLRLLPFYVQSRKSTVVVLESRKFFFDISKWSTVGTIAEKDSGPDSSSIFRLSSLSTPPNPHLSSRIKE